MLTKKHKGDIGLTQVTADLTTKGYNVSLPIAEHLSYDLICEIDGTCKTIQVRYCTAKDGLLEVKLRSCWSNKKGTHYKTRTSGDFDILAIYCPNPSAVYYLGDSEFSCGTSVSLRTEKPSKYASKFRMADEYADIKKIWMEGN